MKARILSAIAATVLALVACGKKAEPPPPAPGPPPAPETAPTQPAPAEAASFIGRTWEVAESQQVAKGSHVLYRETWVDLCQRLSHRLHEVDGLTART